MRRSANLSRFVSILNQLPRVQKVLELGCGDDPEAALYFVPIGTTIFGIDHNRDVLCSIHAYYPYLIQADITRLPLRTEFDLIIARHPDIDRRRVDWQYAISSIAHWLSPNGILLLTLYSIGEYEQVRLWLRTTGLTTYPLLPDTLTPPALDGRDRFVVVYSNPSLA